MPLPQTSIEKALTLLVSTTPVRTSYSYFLATSMPTYAIGQSTGYSASQNGPAYLFGSSTPTDFLTLSPFAAAAFGASVGNIEAVAGVTLTDGTDTTAQIVAFGLNVQLYNGTEAVYGFSPNSASTTTALEFDVVLMPNGHTDVDTGGTVIHELLHSMGLDHANATVFADEGDDLARYTVMGRFIYDPEGRYPTEPQLYDVAALQALYGRNTSTFAGDTSHSSFTETAEPFVGSDRIFCLWDASGENDSIDANLRTTASLIDLRPGHFSSIGPGASVALNGGATPSLTNAGTLNMSIAFGTYIENAIGSSTGDLIIGNLLSNVLEGRNGDDVIYAEGTDSLHEAGDGIYDQVSHTETDKKEDAPTGVIEFVSDTDLQEDILKGGDGNDYLHGGRGGDRLEGGIGIDFLFGGDGDDVLLGGAGDDEIWGGKKDDDQGAADGTDTVDYSAVTSRITITFNGGSTPSLTVADGQGGTDTLRSIETIVGTARADYLYYSGTIPTAYTLTIDAAGGNDVVANAQGAETSITLNLNGVGTGTLTSAGGGTIILQNFSTQIIGSYYDDEITDVAEHDGLKRVDASDGNDIVTVDGSDAMLKGGYGDDELTAGDGADILYGGAGEDIVHGGGGADYLETRDADAFAEWMSEEDELFGDGGHDYLRASATTSGATLSGGAGNDVIDARGSGVAVIFGEGDGHDMIRFDEVLGHGVDRIDMSSVSKAGISFLWDPQVLVDHELPSGVPQDTPGYLTRRGDLVIRIDATGDTILIPNVLGTTTYWSDESEASQGPFDGPFDYVNFPDLLLNVEFSDGTIDQSDFLGSTPVVAIAFGSVSAYATALDDYEAAVAAAPGANDGTSGDDDLRGSRGDDEVDGGDGDDSLHSSGGTDTVDGGDGNDVLNLFGSRWHFTITGLGGGAFSVVDQTGVEGTIAATSVEAVYFAGDNLEYSREDLLGYYGTSSNDTVTGSALDNELYGLDGDDALHGLAGDDVVDGGDGFDTAHFAGSSTDFRIYLDPGGGIVAIDNGDSDPLDEGWNMLVNVESLYFAGDNVTLGPALDLPPLGTAGPDVLDGTARQDTLFGAGDDDELTGLAGDDGLYGGTGNDQYDGGPGHDYQEDEGGDDSYSYAAGEGIDTISDYGGYDILLFGSGIDPADVTVTDDGWGSYVLTFANLDGSVTLLSQLHEDYGIEEVRFADTTVWTDEDLYDLANGGPFLRGGGGGGAGGGETEGLLWQRGEMSLAEYLGAASDMHMCIP